MTLDELTFDRSGSDLVVTWSQRRGDHRMILDTWAPHIDPEPGNKMALRMIREIEASRTEREVVDDLLDDLADVLAKTVVGWNDVIGHDLSQAPEVQRVMARYRNWKHEGNNDE